MYLNPSRVFVFKYISMYSSHCYSMFSRLIAKCFRYWLHRLVNLPIGSKSASLPAWWSLPFSRHLAPSQPACHPGSVCQPACQPVSSNSANLSARWSLSVSLLARHQAGNHRASPDVWPDKTSASGGFSICKFSHPRLSQGKLTWYNCVVYSLWHIVFCHWM